MASDGKAIAAQTGVNDSKENGREENISNSKADIVIRSDAALRRTIETRERDDSIYVCANAP